MRIAQIVLAPVTRAVIEACRQISMTLTAAAAVSDRPGLPLGIMLSDENLERYARQAIMPDIGEEGQERLLAARVLVVGAGGLGSPAILYLAAAGIGHITVIDPEHVELTNLNRQISIPPPASARRRPSRQPQRHWR